MSLRIAYQDPERDMIKEELKQAIPERRGRPSGAAYEARQVEIEQLDERLLSRVDRARAAMADPSDGTLRNIPCPRCAGPNAIGSADWVACLLCGQEFTPPTAATAVPERVDLEIATRAWDPHDTRTASCSNCAHCIVYGPPDQPLARCGAGHGATATLLWPLIRLRGSLGFVVAPAQCPDFDSMSSDDD